MAKLLKSAILVASMFVAGASYAGTIYHADGSTSQTQTVVVGGQTTTTTYGSDGSIEQSTSY